MSKKQGSVGGLFGGRLFHSELYGIDDAVKDAWKDTKKDVKQGAEKAQNEIKKGYNEIKKEASKKLG